MLAYCCAYDINICYVSCCFVDLFELLFVCLGEGSNISHQFSIPSCENTQQKFVCQEKNFVQYSEEITLVLSKKSKNDTLHNYFHTLGQCDFFVVVFFFFLPKHSFVFRFCVQQLRLW